MVIVVVDDGGHLLVLERLDDTQVASVEVGIGKARTAAIFRRPSKVFEDQVRDGRVAALALPGATPLQGGVPIIYEGKVIGAIGVSGNTPRKMKTSQRPAPPLPPLRFKEVRNESTNPGYRSSAAVTLASAFCVGLATSGYDARKRGEWKTRRALRLTWRPKKA